MKEAKNERKKDLRKLEGNDERSKKGKAKSCSRVWPCSAQLVFNSNLID